MAKTVSPGHKLGQMVGEFIEDLFASRLETVARELGLFCDRRGPRPARAHTVLVEWKDSQKNTHQLDYVLERDGTLDQLGQPVAFIELAWRRYTKHSINKASEIEGALLHLKDTYPSCRFIGAILAGEYTAGAKAQLTSRGIVVVHVPFAAVAEAFSNVGVDLSYAEKAAATDKRKVIKNWNSLPQSALQATGAEILAAIKGDFEAFLSSLRNALCSIELVRVTPLFGKSHVFSSVQDAIAMLRAFDEAPATSADIVRYEVEVRYANGESLCRVVFSRERALEYLDQLQ